MVAEDVRGHWLVHVTDGYMRASRVIPLPSVALLQTLRLHRSTGSLASCNPHITPVRKFNLGGAKAANSPRNC